MTAALLADWNNFYVITGSAAAGLTGLTFVVIALAADTKRVRLIALRAYVSPIIVHFCAVLSLAAYLSMPHQSVCSLSIGFGAVGIAGLAYVTRIGIGITRIVSDYIPVHEDWIWNVVLPAIAYGVLLGTACFIWTRPERSLYAAAAVSLLLMFIGIHNAWDIAVWNTVNSKQDDSPPGGPSHS
jgi:cytochrome bd-type quinol oxidase subunit 2